jgi:hypothetical protein
VTDEALDVLVVGSSPLLLIEALYLAHTGRRVTIAEQSARFGGAWSTRPLWEFESVEIACHYVERGRRGYALLRDGLGIELEPRSVKAVWLNADASPRGKPYLRTFAVWLLRKALWGRFLSDDAWGVIKSLGRKDPFKFGRAVRRMLVQPPYLYPVKGSKALVDALVRLVRSSPIVLMNNARVEEVVLGENGRPSRCCINGRTCSMNTLVLGQHVYARLPMAEAAATEPEAQYEINVLLRVAGAKAVPFDYIEIHRNDLVNRVADVSAFAHPPASAAQRSSDLLICCNLTRPGDKESTVVATNLFTHLIEVGLLARGSELLDSHVERYPTPLRTAFESTDAVRVLRTYDLGVELERNADRWQSVLVSAPATEPLERAGWVRARG